MEIKVRARTFEVNDAVDTIEQRNHDLTLLAGKTAGVCYMPDDYMDNGIQNEKAAFNRADNTANNGHHSTYDHGYISYEMHVSKMICMILNSLNVYTTSEKSSRYTKMNPKTQLEKDLYEKWIPILQNRILEVYPWIDDDKLNKGLAKKISSNKENKIVKHRNISAAFDEYKYLKDELDKLKQDVTIPSYKLAQENARYMISVFTPTIMIYTMSDRQSQLVLDYMYKLKKSLEWINDEYTTGFITLLLDDVNEFITKFEIVLGECKIHDTKNQYIRFLEAQHVGDVKIYFNKETNTRTPVLHKNGVISLSDRKKESIGDSYTLDYEGSLAMLAQDERHRTTRVQMFLQYAGQFGFYTPPILKGTNLEEEWKKDIESVSYCVPQGTIVKITEQGIFEDFVLKCKERLCGCAQLEIMQSTVDNLNKFIKHKDLLCKRNKDILDTITNNHYEKVVTRCLFKDYNCTSPCMWGSSLGLDRLV